MKAIRRYSGSLTVIIYRNYTPKPGFLAGHVALPGSGGEHVEMEAPAGPRDAAFWDEAAARAIVASRNYRMFSAFSPGQANDPATYQIERTQRGHAPTTYGVWYGRRPLGRGVSADQVAGLMAEVGGHGTVKDEATGAVVVVETDGSQAVLDALPHLLRDYEQAKRHGPAGTLGTLRAPGAPRRREVYIEMTVNPFRGAYRATGRHLGTKYAADGPSERAAIAALKKKIEEADPEVRIARKRAPR